jgi:ankyrin repeat protein
MFESLDPLERTVDRRLPLLIYSTFAVVSLLFLILEVRRHGFSQPFWPVVLAAVFLLSLTWLVTTLRSTVALTYREVHVRYIILALPIFVFAHMDTLVPNSRIYADPTEILRAAGNGDLQETRLLLKHNPNLVFTKNSEGFTALHYAAFHGYTEVAKLLLAEKADVNAKTSRGGTPLQYAVWYGHEETVQLLLSSNADVDVRGEIGGTPLYDAAAKGQIEQVRMLLAAKADVNARTLRGYTALSVAASDGREDVARLLIDNGANVNDKDMNGCTALYWARIRGHERVEDLLRQHGGLELPRANPESSSR